MLNLLRIILLSSSCTWSALATAEPYRPSSDAEVLVELPNVLRGRAGLRIERLRRALEVDPRNAQAAEALASHYRSLARITGDPRYVGMARSVLMPWWDGEAKKLGTPELPLGILHLRADLRQYDHDFTGSLADYAAILDRTPHDVDAALATATLHQVQGRYTAARSGCQSLDKPLATLCLASVETNAGRMEIAAALFEQLKGVELSELSLRAWYQEIQGRLELHAGQIDTSLALLKQAMNLDPTQSQIQVFYLDLLLERGDATQVLAWQREAIYLDVLPVNLRIARAMRLLGQEGDLTEEVRQEIEAESRDEGLHHREIAYYYIFIEPEAFKAMAAAKRNWLYQREPVDTWLYLLSAKQKGESDWQQANQEVERWSQLEKTTRESLLQPELWAP